MKHYIDEIYYKPRRYDLSQISKVLGINLIRFMLSDVGEIKDGRVEIDTDLLKIKAEKMLNMDNKYICIDEDDAIRLVNFTYILCFEKSMYRVYYSHSNNINQFIDNGLGEKLSVSEYCVKSLLE